jgi:general secretion pathway protein I
MTRRRQKGMTLIEVLVAMAILGTVAGSVLVMTGQSAQFVVASEERLLARIVADNAMVVALARQASLEEGFEQDEVELGGRVWKTAKTIARIGVDGLYRVEIAVSLDESTQVLTRVSTLAGGAR